MPRKGENIYKRKDGRWEARYIHHYENGKAKYKSVYGYSYAEAKRNDELSKPENMRVSVVKQFAMIDKIAVLWLRNRRHDVKESTYSQYIRIIHKYVVTPFDKIKLVRIDSKQISEYFEGLKLSLSIKTIADIRCIFMSVWKFGQENGYPCNRCKPPFYQVFSCLKEQHQILRRVRYIFHNSAGTVRIKYEGQMFYYPSSLQGF